MLGSATTNEPRSHARWCRDARAGRCALTSGLASLAPMGKESASSPGRRAHMRDGAATPALSAVPSAAALARYSQGRKKPSRPPPWNCSAQPARRAATCLGPTRSAHLIRPPLRARARHL